MSEKKEWPAVITEAILAKNAGVTDAELDVDIRDTEEEIQRYQKVMDAEEMIAGAHPSEPIRKMAAFRAGGYREMIRERTAFLTFVKGLRDARAALRSGTLPPPEGDGEQSA